MKNVKQLLGVFVIVCALLIVPNNVDAAMVESSTDLKTVFEEKGASVNGKTVTLTKNIDDEDVYEIGGDDYILDLNGYKLTAGEFYINDGSLTINDSKGKGELDTAFDWIWVEEGAKLIINNGKFDFLVNAGTTIINNGKADMLTNDGTMTIKAGTFGGIWQRGNATINGGIFTAEFAQSAIDLDNGTTVITGNVEFKRTQENNALMINSSEEIDETAINRLVSEGYIPVKSGYGTNSDSWYDEELGETVYRYEVTYDQIIVMKDDTDEIFDKIAPNGVLTLNVEKPDNDEKAYFFLSEVVRNMAKTDKYRLEIAFPSEGDFDPENGVISFYKQTGEWITDKKVKVAYNESDKSASAKVAPIIKKIVERTKDETNEENSFILEDLYLINYLNSLKDGINSEMSLNFSKELIELTNGSNIAYKFDTRMGSSSAGLWFYLGGWGVVYYNGEPIDGAKIGITRSHVLYVPSDTLDTDEARIEAALKRIKDYLGTTDGIKIEVGGTLESTGSEEYHWNYYGFIDEKTSGKNYYNITINGKTYKFAICKKDAKELENPKYIASDLMSNISIKSDSSELPLDTAITVKSVTSDEIKKALGTSVYAAYDISLYSNAKQVNITKLENSKFIVSIPVPENLKNKEITVYYINNKGEKEEHVATVKDGIASFETDHFSTYVLAEKTNISNPNTYDGITTNILIGIISLTSLIGLSYYLIKENKARAK